MWICNLRSWNSRPFPLRISTFVRRAGFAIPKRAQHRMVMASHQNPHVKLQPDVRFKVARADAIESYSILESALSRLFADVLETKPSLAGIVFFRTANARARNSIIDALIKRKHGPKFNPYWNFLLKFISRLDSRRNEIVHWRQTMKVNFGRTRQITSISLSLVPPNLWDRKPSKNRLTEHDLSDFSLRCDFAAAAIWTFIHYSIMRGRGSRARRDALRNALELQLTYPPTENHPIRRRWPKPVVLLQPSRR
jgi:hypothetical protein